MSSLDNFHYLENDQTVINSLINLSSLTPESEYDELSNEVDEAILHQRNTASGDLDEAV
jgi:hypothetical protein